MTLGRSPFEIDPDEIAQLDTQRLVQLLNTLLRNEGVKLGLPANGIKLTADINTPDGGIDLSIDTTFEGRELPGHSQYLDPGFTVVQYKRSWTNATKVKKELQKPEVQNAFASGANYILITGNGMVPATQAKRENDLRGWAKAAGCTGSVRLYVADHVAGWTSEVPAARAAFRSEIQNYLQASYFLDHEQRHAIPFESDASRQALMDEITTSCWGKNRLQLTSGFPVQLASENRG